MSILIALLLGIIQGLTEFLPISSSGHLMIFESIFHLSENMFFNVLVHFATLMAVVLVFWKDVCYLIKHPLSNRALQIVVASIPTAIIALVINHFFSEYSLYVFLGFGFLISAFVIGLMSILQRKKAPRSYNLNYKQALLIGVVQGFAVLPGVSRSGSTICASLLMGVDREESARFSFLISIPVIIGGMIFEIVDCVKVGATNINALSCIIGFIAAFVTAMLTIKLMMKIVKKGNWWYFSLYLLLLGIFIVLNQFVLGWI